MKCQNLDRRVKPKCEFNYVLGRHSAGAATAHAWSTRGAGAADLPAQEVPTALGGLSPSEQASTAGAGIQLVPSCCGQGKAELQLRMALCSQVWWAGSPEPIQPLTLSHGLLTGPCWGRTCQWAAGAQPVPVPCAHGCQLRRHFPHCCSSWAGCSHSSCPLALLTVTPVLHPSHYCCVVGAGMCRASVLPSVMLAKNMFTTFSPALPL